jgi:ditrans,polycis-polyprenyl diphosphate synthase
VSLAHFKSEGCKLIVLFSALVDKYQIGVRFLGNLDYLPADVREIANKVAKQTKNHTK